jgi:hypothetical protein
MSNIIIIILLVVVFLVFTKTTETTEKFDNRYYKNNFKNKNKKCSRHYNIWLRRWQDKCVDKLWYEY